MDKPANMALWQFCTCAAQANVHENECPVSQALRFARTLGEIERALRLVGDVPESDGWIQCLALRDALRECLAKRSDAWNADPAHPRIYRCDSDGARPVCGIYTLNGSDGAHVCDGCEYDRRPTVREFQFEERRERSRRRR